MQRFERARFRPSTGSLLREVASLLSRYQLWVVYSLHNVCAASQSPGPQPAEVFVYIEQ